VKFRCQKVKIGNSSFEKGGRVKIFGNNLKKIKIIFRKKLRAD
jgi:hypothetical protein